mgnify:CR=1 FL=1
MQEIIQFVSNSITGGVAYDSLKVILGSSFNKLTSYLSNNEKEKFEGALEILLEQNEEMKQQIIELQKGKSIVNDKSIKIGGQSSGINVTGNNNIINKE